MKVTFMAKEEEQRKSQKIQKKTPPVTTMMTGGVYVSGKVLWLECALSPKFKCWSPSPIVPQNLTVGSRVVANIIS